MPRHLRAHRGDPGGGATVAALIVDAGFLGDLAAGNFIAEPVVPQDWLRIAELVGAYRDLPLGTVDASVLALCERLDARQLATLDRRHFTVVRPSHVDALQLLP